VRLLAGAWPLGSLQVEGQPGALFDEAAHLGGGWSVVTMMDKREKIAAADGFHTESVGIAGAVVIEKPGSHRNPIALPGAPGFFDEIDRRGVIRKPGLRAQPFALESIGLPVIDRSLNYMGARLAHAIAPLGERCFGYMRGVAVESLRQCGNEELAVLFRDVVFAAGEQCGGMFHGLDTVRQEIARASGGHECADSVSEIRCGVLMLDVQEGIDDRAVGVLVTDTEAADAFDDVEITLAGG